MSLANNHPTPPKLRKKGKTVYMQSLLAEKQRQEREVKACHCGNANVNEIVRDYRGRISCKYGQGHRA